jgi:Type II secretory pathway, component PulF
MFADGVPLVDALAAVPGADSNSVFSEATKKIQNSVSMGTALTAAMGNTEVFPVVVMHMTHIGE